MKEHVATAETSGFRLRYYRTTQKSIEDENKLLHGIYVAKLDGENVLEHAQSGPVTEDVGHIIETITYLAENTVTPMMLCEILDDAYPFLPISP